MPRVLFYERAGCAAAMILPTFSGAKNAAGEIVPAFIFTKPSIADSLPAIAAKSCCICGGGGSSLASWQVNSYIGSTCSSRAR